MGAEKPAKANGAAAGSYCRRPPARPLLQRLRYAVWDPDERTFLGRSPHRWGVIGLIYLVMYICIIIFFSLCMCGLLSVLDERVPYFTLADSIIGDSPGMGHRPQLLEDGALVWYRAAAATDLRKYTDHLDDFLAPYENKSLLAGGGATQQECGGGGAARGRVCAFSPGLLGACAPGRGYGYAERTPCFIIKLNKIFDWRPQPYSDPRALPADMPPDLVAHINQTSPEERDSVWVSCAGERPADREALGPLRYWPAPALPARFYPYDNTPGYLSPLVAVQLLRPRLHQIINIRCRAWARNIVYSDSLKDRLGSTHLEIMVD